MRLLVNDGSNQELVFNTPLILIYPKIHFSIADNGFVYARVCVCACIYVHATIGRRTEIKTGK